MMNAPLQHGPYAQPEDPYRAQAPGAAFAPIKPTTRFVFTALVAVMMIGFITAVAAITLAIVSASAEGRHEPDDTLVAIGAIAFVTVILLLYGQIAAGLVWVHKAWSWLPWDQRYTRHWRGWISPGQATWMLLIPYFHYYWMFVANLGLCEALDRLRVTYPTRHAAPRNLVIAACICQLVVPFPVGSILWLVFMAKIERMTHEMSASMAPRRHNAL